MNNIYVQNWIISNLVLFFSRIQEREVCLFATDLLNGLFDTLEISGSEDNEYVMKAIMRSFAILQDNVLPHLTKLLPKLTDKLVIIAKNPSRPNFNHYLFETLSLTIK